MIRIALLFALPQEYASFKRLMGPWRLRSRNPFKSFTYSVGGQQERLSVPKGGRGESDVKELILLETGMGHERTLEALEWLLGWFHPDLVVTSGFAGSLARDLMVGDVCLGEVFASLDGPPRPQAERRGNLRISEGLAHFWRDHRIRRARIVTATQPKPKEQLSGKFSDIPSVMDMETYFVAQFCCRNRLPCLSLRAVSDGLGDAIDFDLTAISDAQGHVKIPLVLASVLKSPRLLKSYYRSWKRSRTAATSLGKALCGLIELPPSELRSLMNACADR
jgi:nucleoside phosphorylase